MKVCLYTIIYSETRVPSIHGTDFCNTMVPDLVPTDIKEIYTRSKTVMQYFHPAALGNQIQMRKYQSDSTMIKIHTGFPMLVLYEKLIVVQSFRENVYILQPKKQHLIAMKLLAQTKALFKESKKCTVQIKTCVILLLMKVYYQINSKIIDRDI